MEWYSEKRCLSIFKESLADNDLPVIDDIIYIGEGRLAGALPTLSDIFYKEDIPFDVMFCPEHRAALEISHLLMARKWRYNKSDVVLVTARPYSYYKLPVPVVYMNSELHEVAYEGVKLLLNVVAQDGPASPQKLEIIPTMETIGFGM